MQVTTMARKLRSLIAKAGVNITRKRKRAIATGLSRARGQKRGETMRDGDIVKEVIPMMRRQGAVIKEGGICHQKKLRVTKRKVCSNQIDCEQSKLYYTSLGYPLPGVARDVSNEVFKNKILI